MISGDAGEAGGLVGGWDRDIFYSTLVGGEWRGGGCQTGSSL